MMIVGIIVGHKRKCQDISEPDIVNVRSAIMAKARIPHNRNEAKIRNMQGRLMSVPAAPNRPKNGHSNWTEQCWMVLGSARRIFLEQLIADGKSNSQIMFMTGCPYGAIHKLRNRDSFTAEMRKDVF